MKETMGLNTSQEMRKLDKPTIDQLHDILSLDYTTGTPQRRRLRHTGMQKRACTNSNQRLEDHDEFS